MGLKMDIESRYPVVWVIIPAFNEAAVIGEVIADVRSVFDHVVCVDDGSADGTADIAGLAGAHVVRHPINLGQGAAIQTGVEYARKQPGAQLFATFDADGQHRVKDLAAMVALRTTFNPEGRCNPFKMLPGGAGCIERKSPGRAASA